MKSVAALRTPICLQGQAGLPTRALLACPNVDARVTSPIEGEVWVLRITTNHRAFQLALLSCFILAACAWHPVCAAERPAPEYLADENQREGVHYFVDFHARSRPFPTGHNFIVYGRLNTDGKIIESKVVGFAPDTDRYWMASFIPAPGLLGRERADFTESSTVIYRRHLTAVEFHQLNDRVRQIRAMRPNWHLIFSNCNNFVGEIAKAIGLFRPPSLLPPSIYVSLLRDLNGS